MLYFHPFFNEYKYIAKSPHTLKCSLKKQFFNKQSSINRYNSPNPTDYIGRISVNRNPLDWDTSIIYKNPDPKLTERKYFGPVKLVKFKIRLLNDKGFEVNLNDRDWSFSIIVSHLYQY